MGNLLLPGLLSCYFISNFSENIQMYFSYYVTDIYNARFKHALIGRSSIIDCKNPTLIIYIYIYIYNIRHAAISSTKNLLLQPDT